MALPGATPMPLSLYSLAGAVPGASVLIELAFDQPRQCLDRHGSIAPGRGDLDEGARGGREHHQPHDRTPGDRGAVLAHPDVGLELRGRFDKAAAARACNPYWLQISTVRRAVDGVCAAASVRFLAGSEFIAAHRRAAAKRH